MGRGAGEGPGGVNVPTQLNFQAATLGGCAKISGLITAAVITSDKNHFC